MPSAKTPPHSVPSLRTVLRLCRQYRRQQTAAAKGFPLRTRPAVSDSRKERIGTSVDSHQVGEPTHTRSYSRSVTTSGIRIFPGRRRSSDGIIPSTSRKGWHGELPESVRVARVDELDRGQVHLTAAAAKHPGHGLDHLQRLLCVGVVDEQDRGFPCGIHLDPSLGPRWYREAVGGGWGDDAD